MSYVVARTIEDALAAIEGGAEVIAGGTDWFPAKGDHVGDVSLLDVMSLPGWSEIVPADGGWSIGAGVTWTDVLRADLPPCFDALKQAAHQVGSVQIQNVGTIIGNICNASPAADGVPPLLVLGVEVECHSVRGPRRVPLAKFLLGPRKTALAPDELVTGLRIPPQPSGAVSAFSKAGSRAYLVISIAMVAVQACVEGGRLSDVRIAVGSCGPVACRLWGLEARLAGVAEVTVTIGDLSELSPIADVRGSAEYRLDVVAEMATRLLRGMV